MVNSFRLERTAWQSSLGGSFVRILQGKGVNRAKMNPNSILGRMGQTFVTPLWRGKGPVPTRNAIGRAPALSTLALLAAPSLFGNF